MSNRLESLTHSVALLLMAFSGTLYFSSLAIFNGSSLLGFTAVMFLSCDTDVDGYRPYM